MIDRKPPSGSTEAAHHFIADEENPVTIANLAKALKISVRRDDQTVRSRHGLDEDGGDSVRSFVSENFLDLVKAFPREHRVAVAFAVEMASIFIRIEEAHYARNARLIGPSPRIARK